MEGFNENLENFIILKGLEDQLHKAQVLGREEEFFSDLIKSFEDDIEKGGKKANVGEIRSFGGRDFIKTPEGWKFHGKGKSKEKEDENFAHKSNLKDLIAKETNPKAKEFLRNAWDASLREDDSLYRENMKKYKEMKEGKSSEVEVDHGIKEGDKVRDFYGKEHKVREVRGNTLYTSKGDSLHYSKVTKVSTDKEKKEIKSGHFSSYSDNDLHTISTDPDFSKEEVDEAKAEIQRRKEGGSLKRGSKVTYKGKQDQIAMIHPNGKALLVSGATVNIGELELSKEKESKSSQGKHISDMSKEEKIAAALKFGIKDAQNLSTKELDKQLIDKNVEKQLKEFQERKKN